MKYNTISTSSFYAEGRDSPEETGKEKDKMYSEEEVSSIRGELEMVQKALKLQTKRCRHLVAQYTRKLQEKEQQYQSEKLLRDDQLAKVLRALLIFEARLKQEQKFLSHQLQEKDFIIKKQQNDIQKLICGQYCKNCKVYYSPSSNMESLESSSEYCATDFQDNHSSNFESLDSSSETYATVSEREYNSAENETLPELTTNNVMMNAELNQHVFIKNKNKDSLSRRKRGHRKSIGTYFEVLKLNNLNSSSNDSSQNISLEVNNESVIENGDENPSEEKIVNPEGAEINSSKITETIPLFDGGDTNDTWYASASDQEDEERRDVYRDNPVLECMNQILLQNMNDAISSPPKTPNTERKSLKNKRVKFQDEDIIEEEDKQDYYETPIQKLPNFYETPQSVCSSNSYEQILSRPGDDLKIENKQEKEISKMSTQKLSIAQVDPEKTSHYYIDMSENGEKEVKPVRKSKILRPPPALPPKPANLLSKYKIQILNNKNKSDKTSESGLDSEPDYCSISELNLPIKKNISPKRINVVAEINAPPKEITKETENTYDPVIVNEIVPSMMVKKNIEKFNELKQKESSTIKLTKIKSSDAEIPKLPQVSEIIIPDETPKQEERISYDNYVKNNSQILKTKHTRTDNVRHPIVIGTSVSSLISGFNTHQIISEISPKQKNKHIFSSFENLKDPPKEVLNDFDLSQNFEEFKLDDCEIEEYQVEDLDLDKETKNINDVKSSAKINLNKTAPELRNHENVQLNLNLNSVKQLKEKLEQQKCKFLNTNVGDSQKTNNINGNGPTYEHFLECTGLSSKSILTPSRMLSNHKSMLKPKDVKLRSRVAKTNNSFERHSTIKYWSEPYI